MLNFLLICVNATQNEEYLDATYQKITQFFTNVIDAQIFNLHEDRFIIYLEDLYERHDCEASAILEFRLRGKLNELRVINAEFRTNNIRRIIVDYLGIFSAQQQPNIDEHLELFYKIARIGAAPTLVKELIQQFGLHYETIHFQCTTVYHDLDMRYELGKGMQVRAIYQNTHDPIIAPVKSMFADSGKFDVFWGINTRNVNNRVFLDVFLNTLYFTICDSYWGMHQLDAERIKFLKLRILKKHLSFLHSNTPSLPEDYEELVEAFETAREQLSENQIDALFQLTINAGQSISDVNQTRNEVTAVVGLHNGERVIPPFESFAEIASVDEVYGAKNERGSILPQFFMPSYIIPLRKWYQERYQIVPPPNQLSNIYIPFPQHVIDNMIFDIKSFTQTQGHETVYISQKLGLTKTLRLFWKRIPIFPSEEIISIISAYPYMEDVIRITVPLREFAFRSLPPMYLSSSVIPRPPLQLIPVPNKQEFWKKLSQQY